MSTKTKKSTRSALGAPSQHNQSSRKGKKAWRKNVDIQEVEEGMEELRSEERATGTYLHKQDDGELFVVDVKGDEKVRSAVRTKYKPSELTSLRILKQRSAVPALVSRVSTSTTKKRKAPLSAKDKERLLRIGKRARRGPLNSVLDPTEFGNGSAALEVSEAVKNSGGYDVWGQEEEEEVKDGLEGVKARKIKAPVYSHPRDSIEVPAIVEPHQGTSYNPPADAHQDLLREAHEREEKREAEAKRLAEEKARFERARGEVEETLGIPAGMKVDEPGPVEDDEDDAEVILKTMPQRKTKAQRNKAARVLAEKRALIERARKKNELALVNSLRQLRRTANKTLSEREQAQALRHTKLREKLKRGLAGQKLGKHRVPVGEVDVQLGEDLSESLRGLKPEGNLFRDRFTSLQQRALIEPRVPVMPKRRRHRIIEYEKHAWKRFDRQ